MKRPELIQAQKALAQLASGLALLIWLLPVSTTRGQEKLPQSGKPTESLLEAPDSARVFRLESEATLKDRMTEDARKGMNPLAVKYELTFPTYPPVSKDEGGARYWPPLPEVVEPPYLCYGRLYFEQINAERYGWDLGIIGPVLSTGVFYFDVAMFPYHFATRPCQRCECNAGYCLPGDPVPLLLYPHEWSTTGAAAKAGNWSLLFAIFP